MPKSHMQKEITLSLHPAPIGNSCDCQLPADRESPSNPALALWMQPNSVSGHPEQNLMKASGNQSDRQAVVESWSIWHDDYFSKISAWG